MKKLIFQCLCACLFSTVAYAENFCVRYSRESQERILAAMQNKEIVFQNVRPVVEQQLKEASQMKFLQTAIRDELWYRGFRSSENLRKALKEFKDWSFEEQKTFVSGVFDRITYLSRTLRSNKWGAIRKQRAFATRWNDLMLQQNQETRLSILIHMLEAGENKSLYRFLESSQPRRNFFSLLTHTNATPKNVEVQVPTLRLAAPWDSTKTISLREGFAEKVDLLNSSKNLQEDALKIVFTQNERPISEDEFMYLFHSIPVEHRKTYNYFEWQQQVSVNWDFVAHSQSRKPSMHDFAGTLIPKPVYEKRETRFIILLIYKGLKNVKERVSYENMNLLFRLAQTEQEKVVLKDALKLVRDLPH